MTFITIRKDIPKTVITPRFTKVAAKTVRLKIPEIALPEPVSMNLELVDLEHDNCRFSTGHDDHKGHLFCGHTVKGRASWCPYHCERVFQKREKGESN